MYIARLLRYGGQNRNWYWVDMFDVEKAIQAWRKKLEKEQGLEPGYIEELESHLRDSIDEFMEDGLSAEQAFEKAAQERIGHERGLAGEFYKAYSNKAYKKPHWELQNDRTGIFDTLFTYIGLPMAYRNIRNNFRSAKNLSYFSLKLIILTVGITFFVGASLYVHHERSYDAHHTNSDRIYRVIVSNEADASVQNDRAVVPLPLIPSMREQVSAVEDAFRLFRLQSDAGIKVGSENFLEPEFFFAEKEMFDVLDIDFIYGSNASLFDNPDDVVLNYSTAKKYFGNVDPVGKSIQYVTLRGDLTTLVVKGVFKDFPSTSHVHPSLIANYRSSHNLWYQSGASQNWALPLAWGYILVKPETDIEALTKNLNADFLKSLPLLTAVNNPDISLRALTDIHLYSDLQNEIEQGGDPELIKILDIIAYFILAIAGLNYVILSIANQNERNKSIAIMRVHGATQFDLFLQHVVQSVFQVLLSILFSAFLLYLIHAYLIGAAGISLDFMGWPIYQTLYLLLALLLFSILIGLLPVLRLTFDKALYTLKGVTPIHDVPRLFSLKNGLVMMQLAFAVFSLFAIIVITSQMSFIDKRDKGFDESSVIAVTWRSGIPEDVFRSELLQNPNIVSVSSGPRVPGGRALRTIPYRSSYMGEQDRADIPTWYVDPFFMDLFDVQVIQGRNFDAERGTDARDAVILTKKASQLLLLDDDPIGKDIQIFNSNTGQLVATKTVIGIVQDLNFESLREEPKPILFGLKDIGGSRMMIKIAGNDLAGTVRFINDTWDAYQPDLAMEYYFLDEAFQAKYKSERTLQNLVLPISIIAICVSALGLFSFMAFSVQLMMKSVSIRKVLGASFRELYLHVIKNYVFSSIIVLIITIPIAQLVMQQWLNNYVQHIQIGLEFYLLVSAIVCAVVILTTSYHSIKTVSANPVHVLKSE